MLLTKLDPCATWFNVQKRPFSNRLLSTPAVKRLRELITQSLDKGSSEEDNGYLPTRLLDVGSTTEPCLRLVSMRSYPQLQPATANAFANRYAAISYCWGAKEDAEKQLKTTTSTLQQHLLGIELQDMPQTIADAVELCRAIGLRYLWVDALCIIQDDDDDWTRESFEMSNIYANSLITFCVVTGASCAAGFLERRHSPNTLQINFKSEMNSSVEGKLFLRMYKHPTQILTTKYTKMSAFDGLIKDDILEVPEWQHGNAPWFQRGWTYQESYFSKRKLLIGDDMVYMWHEDKIESMDGTRYQANDRLQLTLDASESSRQSSMNQWYDMVRSYVRRRLSYERDRLPALSGLARAVANSFPDLEYLGGLWRADLHRGLFWVSATTQNYEDYTTQRQSEYFAPSWSWASRPGPICWFLGVQYPEFELLAANAVTDKLNRYGRVFSAYLELSAKMHILVPLGEEGDNSSIHKKRRHVKHASEKEKAHLGFSYFHYVLRSGNDDYVANLNFDWDWQGLLHDGYGCPYAPTDEIRMLLISGFDLSDGQLSRDGNKLLTDRRVMAGLLVMPAQKAGEFVRVGVWYSVAEGLGGMRFWEDVEPQLIRLV